MTKPLICLTLAGKTLHENAAIVNRYRRYIDIAELRVDYLDEEEQLYVRRFPALVPVPCILTIRRISDGGLFTSGEISRTLLFARALAFSAQEDQKNFAYVDFEDDFHIPSLQDAALAFGIRIIRSFHDIHNPVYNIKQRCDEMRQTGFEIPKIAFMPKTLSDVSNLFYQAKTMTAYEHIVCAMGALGLPSRILAHKLHSYLTYVSPEETHADVVHLGHIDPITLNDVYRFRSLDDETETFGVMGWPLVKTRSPEIHNAGYTTHRMNRVFIPVRAQTIDDALTFAARADIRGYAVTVPFKEKINSILVNSDMETQAIGACNTIMRCDSGWIGRNTDAKGFQQAFVEFLGNQKLRRKKVAIIGAGGAARAIAYVIHQMGGGACIFNRTVSAAKKIAQQYKFKYAELNENSLAVLETYAAIIIQTTSLGMNSMESSNEQNDPIYFYHFKGTEKVFDIVYVPEITPIMARAKEAGCDVCNGLKMLQYQGYEQFKFFTGVDYAVAN
ncbi:MAG: type I 3-dehydroquinate dehydratase [Treponema sp.]|nr:type I 3-dehydroquinate dehydratase [Treponema sp.]